MRLRDLEQFPTVLNTETVAPQRIHESVFRCWHILNRVDELLEAGTPGPVLLDLLREMRELPHREQDASEPGSRVSP